MRSPLSAATLLSPLFALRSALAEPVQYCRPGFNQGEADFCIGISRTVNASTKATDVFFSMTVSRSSAHGWTAIGTGAEMAGSTMFIVYGDPISGSDPVLSIRTIDGHHQPKALDLSTLPGLRVVRSKWQKLPVAALGPRHEDEPNYPIVPTSPASHIADIALACYGCPLQAWKLDINSKSQPFIWAWNDRQEFDSYSVDAHLAMHRHHAGSGGFGSFYVDMPQTLSDSPEPPAIRQGAANFGTSDPPTGFSGFLISLRARPLPKAHGFLMGVAFIVLFPLGVVLMRTPSGNPFKRHWMVQAAATGLTWLGAVAGAVMTGGRAPRTFHQWIGAMIALTLGAQVVLGWRHHMVFLRVRHRTWVSHAHIWIGRAVLGAGWVNVLTGLVMSGYGSFGIAVIGGLVVVEAVGVGLWVWVAQQRAKGKTAPGQTEAHALMATGSEGTEDYFAIDMSDDEFDTDVEDDKGRRSGPKRSVELRERKA
ncbi:hypothetical protein B0T14DRAFT_526669 [Immersiella caudata]|uniref:Cytochrome b561 domain-containing protein n=1 Tax=Immersiella caudata TaxID=314043 RepID=A0AA40BU28_9PEZI|nr:hypothetical protein B0T14DRAFT_526669 [Immersiella caudata]